MEAVAASGFAEIAAIADASAEMRSAASDAAPGADLVSSFEELLQAPLDGLVIATPSALHAEQSRVAVERGLAVFCQKPLGRTAVEAAAVVDAARAADRLLGVDFSYRFTEAFVRAREVVRSGEIGEVFAADLVFHNAYGPDKPWFYEFTLAGGGCVMDLGIHLVDLGLWFLGFPAVECVQSRLLSGGRPLDGISKVEDFATARIDLAGGASLQLACSWKLPAGQDAVISATFYGTSGGVAVHNVGGSFYDFVAEQYHGTSRRTLVEPPDAWGGRAAVDWAQRLASGQRFDPSASEIVRVAEALDLIYGRAETP
jgi:predicted dehydrogenase